MGKGPNTKSRLVDAALDSLKADGFAGSSARAIARRAGLNQALVFYHFGTLHNLLLAALDHTSDQRMSAYEAAIAQVDSLPALLIAARDIYREDLESGHITVLSEMIAGSLTHPELRPQIVRRMEPWIDFAQRALSKGLESLPFERLVPPSDLAFAVVSFYLGADLLTHLQGDRSRTDSLFDAGQALASLLSSENSTA